MDSHAVQAKVVGFGDDLLDRMVRVVEKVRERLQQLLDDPDG